MWRRSTLRLVGGGLTVGLGGCASGRYGRSGTAEPSATGTPGTADQPTAVNRFDYETNPTNGVAVPLVPIDDAIRWYRNGEVLFADARGESAYEAAHIRAAVSSPAPDGRDGDDPVVSAPKDRRIVTYCGCPHHLSSLRAANLITHGYGHTYALDEGFQEWLNRGYPVSGSRVDRTPARYRIDGQVTTGGSRRPEHVWAWHDPSGQREAAPLASDGGFTLHLRFYGVAPSSPIRLVAGSREDTRPLRELTARSVTL